MWRILKWTLFALVGVVSLGMIAIAVSLLAPPPAIQVGKQTTVISSPLTEEGLPDYEAYLLERNAEGVTPENNAAVLLTRALWPSEIEPADQQPILDALGIRETPSEAEALSPLDSPELEVRLSEVLGDETGGAGAEFIARAHQRPWTTEQAPALAEWVAENQSPLDLIVEATKRPRYWFPSPTFLNDRYDMLIETLLPQAQASRAAARGLAIRAMHHLGEGRTEQAWRDTMATYRLSRFIGNGFSLVEALVAIALDTTANRQAVAILHYADLPREKAAAFLRDLETLEPLPPMWSFINDGERLFYADSVLATHSGKDPQFDGALNERFDANLVLRDGNEVYDECVAAMRGPDHVSRMLSLNDFEGRLEQRVTAASQSYGRLALTPFSRRVRSEVISDIYVALMTPAVSAAFSAQERREVTHELAITAAALAVYRAEHGEYPAVLDDLVPKVLEELPIDLYSGKPFLYERKADGGYLLYSVFENGVDDGGDDHGGEIIAGDWVEERPLGFDAEQADLVIRVPLPPIDAPMPAVP
ncbi:MAG: hypothetical protein AAGF31_04855 [Planctomycetota bacterium]